jgi:hypothetical protein
MFHDDGHAHDGVEATHTPHEMRNNWTVGGIGSKPCLLADESRHHEGSPRDTRTSLNQPATSGSEDDLCFDASAFLMHCPVTVH